MRRSPPGSALRRSLDPQGAAWTLEADLLAGVLDRLSWLVWAKTRDGSRNRNQPKPVPRPSNNYGRRSKGRLAGALSLPVDEVRRRLALPRRPIGAPRDASPAPAVPEQERADTGVLAFDPAEAARWSAQAP